MIHIGLFVSMLTIGVSFAVAFHLIAQPLFDNVFLHCLILGVLFGIASYLVAEVFYRKYTRLHINNHSLRQDVRTDNLTGLLNRRAFDQDILNVCSDAVCSVLFLDIDDFRSFNNKFGHEAGDEVLRKVGQTISSNLRVGDKVYRYGGEEIVVLLKDCDKKNAERIAEKMRDEVSQLDNSPYGTITVSMGLACCPEDGNDIPRVINASDKALLEAKRKGKNCTVLC